MARLLVAALMLAMAVGCRSRTSTVAPAIDSTFTISVTGTIDQPLVAGGPAFHSPVPFQGVILVRMADGSSHSQSVEGTVPATYTATGRTVAVNMQKSRTRGSLKVEIVRDGAVLKSAETEADYGVVTAATR